MTVSPSARHAEPGAQLSTVADWGRTLVPIGVALVVFAIGFHREGIDAVSVWLASTAYNHCFLVLPVVGYLLWERRSIIATHSPRPVLWPLLLMPPLAAAWLLAAGLDINEGRQLLVVAMFEVVLLSALGLRLYRLLMAPLLFLFFLIPTGYFLVPLLQRVTADIALASLRLAQVPVFSDGYLIDIPQGQFEIAEACAGLRFLIAATAFGCFFAVVMYRGWLHRACFIAMSIAVAIFANGMRAFGLIYYAHLSGSAAAVMADHVLYGWLFFSLVTALIIVIGMLFAETHRPPILDAPVVAERAGPVWYVLAIPLAALIAVTGPAYATWRNSLVAIEPLPGVASPTVAPPWHRVDQAADWHPLVQGADREFLETFEDGGSAKVTRFLALYRLRATANRMTLSGNRVVDSRQWRIAREGRTAVELPGGPVTVTESDIIRGPYRSLVWSFYVVDGRIVSGLLEAKLLQLRATLHQQRPVGAFVMIEAALGDIDGRRALQRFLTASQSTAEYIEQLR